LSDNVINGTNVFVKCISSGPKNEVKSPSKVKHEERTQRNIELDEFSKTQWDRIIRHSYGRTIRSMQPDYPTYRIKRRRINSDRVQVLVEENQVGPDDPTCTREEHWTNGRSILQRACFLEMKNILRGRMMRRIDYKRRTNGQDQ